MTKLQSVNKRKSSTKMQSLLKQKTTFKVSFKAHFKVCFKSAAVKATAVIDDSVTTTAKIRLFTLAAVFAKQTAAAAEAHEILSLTSTLSFYTVSWNVFWKRKNIYSNIKTSDKFSYQHFNIIIIKKMKQKINAKKYNTVLQNSLITIKCINTVADSISNIKNDKEWKIINEVIISWVREKCKNVAVIIQLIWNTRQKEESFFNDSEFLSISRKHHQRKFITFITEFSSFSTDFDSFNDAFIKKTLKQKLKNKQKKKESCKTSIMKQRK